MDETELVLGLFVSDNSESSDALNEVLSAVVDNVVIQKADELAAELTSKINNEVDTVISACVDAISDAIENAGSQMTQRGKEADAIRQLVQAAIDELDPLVDSVKSLYDMVPDMLKSD